MTIYYLRFNDDLECSCIDAVIGGDGEGQAVQSFGDGHGQIDVFCIGAAIAGGSLVQEGEMSHTVLTEEILMVAIVGGQHPQMYIEVSPTSR